MTSISKAELLKTCKTGDVILFNTRSHWYDWLIEKYTGSMFSHVGMVVRNIKCGDVEDVGICLLESGYEAFPDVVDKKIIYGVQLSRLSEVFDTYIDSEARGGYAYYRKLNYDRPDTFDEDVRKLVESVYDKPYDMLPQDWIRSAFHLHGGNQTRTNTFWCSALLAYVYEKLGFLNEEVKWTTIQPTQFSYHEGKQLELNSKIDLEPEIPIK